MKIYRDITQTVGHTPLVQLSKIPPKGEIIWAKLWGIGVGFAPAVCEIELIDHIVPIKNEEATTMTHRLAREEDIFAGISSGAAVAAAVTLLKEKGFSGKKTVVILPDGGEHDLSTGVFQM